MIWKHFQNFSKKIKGIGHGKKMTLVYQSALYVDMVPL